MKRVLKFVLLGPNGSVKKQKRFDSSLLAPASALQSREAVPEKLKAGNTKDVGSSLRPQVQGTNSPRVAADNTPRNSSKGTSKFRDNSMHFLPLVLIVTFASLDLCHSNLTMLINLKTCC